MRRALLPLLAALALGPLVVLLVASVADGWFWPQLVPRAVDAGAWRSLGSGRLAAASVNSLVLAVATGGVASLLALPIGRALARVRGWPRHLGAAAAFLPVAAPPIALAVGLQITFIRLGLAGTLAGVAIAHLVPALGYTSLFFLGVFNVHDDRLEVEARTLGADARQTFLRVTLPLLRRPLIEAFLLGFLVSWAQVPLTLLVGQGLVPTLAIDVLGFVQAGQTRFAAVGSILLAVPPLLAMAAAGVAIRRTGAVAV